MTKKIDVPFSPPDITEEEIQSVAEVMRSGWLTTGPKTKEFERQMAAFCNVSRGACMNSATSCLEIALRLFEIGQGDEVVVPAYTYTASASVVCHVGATLKLIDAEAGTFHLDYKALEAAITPRTKAVIPVDMGGVMVDYDKIRSIVESKKAMFTPASGLQDALGRILILADSAHGYGSSRDGKMSGECADFTAFSFHAIKSFTTGEGGGLVWRDIPGVDNEEIYRQIMLFSLHGQTKDALAKTMPGAWEYDIIDTYYKCNMTDIMAAIGLAQMKRYASILKRRQEIVKKYTKGIKADDIAVLTHYAEADGSSVNGVTGVIGTGLDGASQIHSSAYLMPVRLLGKGERERNELITRMAEHGIATNVHYKPLPMLTAYKRLGFDIADYPNAYDTYHNEISIPLHTCLTEEQILYVIKQFNSLRK